MNTDNKGFKTEAHLEVLAVLVIFLVCLVGGVVNQLALEKQSQSLLRFKSPLTRSITGAWKMYKSKDIETASNAMEKVVKMSRNAQNAKVEELSKN